MCGIAGYAGRNEIPQERIDRCLALMMKRGPDHQAARAWTLEDGRRTYLLASRLSIIDLDPRANQPFALGSRWIVFNGEIYNYVELRRELNGKRFRTDSDTEVLLAAIESWGVEALDRCEGMWAFAVYDELDGSLVLSRDRFGEKPLYIHRDPSGLYFGSEVKLIAALRGRRMHVDVEHVYRYLVNGYKALYKSGKHSFFEGIEELAPATALRVEADGAETHLRYWRPAFRPDELMSYEEAVAGARDRLIRAVELRLRADVPLAFCMSGGVDSNSLISIAKRVFDYDVHGFTIENTDWRYEERDVIESVVGELDLRHESIPLDTKDFLTRMRTLVRYHDAPVYTITYFAHWLLMQSIAEHGYRISVSGTAADELFSGYYDHHLQYLYEIRDQHELHAASRDAWMRLIRPIVRNPLLANPDAFTENPAQREHIYLNADEFAGYLLPDWWEPFAESRYADSLLRNRMLNEMFHESVPVILHEDDLNAMYYSIENRSPYLDRALFEFCYTIPTPYLVRKGLAKAVLRDAVRGIVPDVVLDNPRKVGFNAPIFSLLDVARPEIRAAILDRGPIFDHVRRDSIEALLAKSSLPNSQSKFLFYFLSSKIFLEEFA